MSAQFGRWNAARPLIARDEIRQIESVLVREGPDGHSRFDGEGISILFRAFHTTKEARCESQPFVCQSGAVVTWDGRLDNRSELIALVSNERGNNAPDVSLVAAAYERWETGCFARLIGDWALSIWEPRTESVLLARDFAGVRKLYYSFDQIHIDWSSSLDALVLFAQKRLSVCEEYIAGWLGHFPDPRLTPYKEIHSVPPSCFVMYRRGRCATSKYWDFNPSREVRYRSDSEYEEHFRVVFGQAVERRLRSDAPVVAELSGGMDSSAVVCVADNAVGRTPDNPPLVETLSYHNDSEPNWNERPFFGKVEEKRGHEGYHIDLSSPESSILQCQGNRFISSPPAALRGTQLAKQVGTWMSSRGIRVLLSGIGGDEATGGVPTPLPELEDLVATLKIRALTHALKIWALTQRKPWLHLLLGASRGFLPRFLLPLPCRCRPPDWIRPAFVRRNRAALQGYEKRLKILGPRPSFQENLATLDLLRRQLGSTVSNPYAPYETRYPYLDRDLLEFLYAIPREQLVRPGRRRSLMRRSLVGIVPQEILERRRKAFVARSPIKNVAMRWADFAGPYRDMTETSRYILDARRFSEDVQRACQGKEVRMSLLLRALAVEVWLKAIEPYGIRTTVR